MLTKPVSQGGLQMKGVIGGNAIAGPTLGAGAPVVTINQTAIVLVGLNRLSQNPALAAKAAQVNGLIGKITPEFKKELVPTPGT